MSRLLSSELRWSRVNFLIEEPAKAASRKLSEASPDVGPRSTSRANGIEAAVEVNEEDARDAEHRRGARQEGATPGQEDPGERPVGEEPVPEEDSGQQDREIEDIAEEHGPEEVTGPALELV